MNLNIRQFAHLITALAFGPLLLSCAASDDEVDGSTFCTINQTETYQVGTNPSVDFNVTNLPKATAFNQVDCPDVNSDSFSSFTSRVKRTDALLTIFERQYYGSQEELNFVIRGTTLLPLRNVFTINSCSIIRTWSGEISIGTNEVVVTENIEYKGLCDHVFNVRL